LPDIFLSYSRDDQAVARRFAEGFERAGLSVWWDQSLKAGEAYDEVTEQALNNARAVVVLWSKKSVASRWVRAEATQANDNKSLMPAMIEACKRPIMFELIQTAELSHWTGDANDPAWRNFLNNVQQLVGTSAAPAGTAAAAPSPVRKKAGMPITVLAVAGLLVAAAGGYFLLPKLFNTGNATVQAGRAGTTQVAGTQTLAVLPFENLSSDPEQEYFADGISEELMNSLTRLKGLQVAGRTSSFYFKGRKDDLATIGSKLGVEFILEGSVRKSGNQLRINAQLINARNGFNLWSETFDSTLDDIFKIQDNIAQSVATALSITMGVGELGQQPGMTRNVQAYAAYLKGRYDKTLYTQEGSNAELQRAIALDATFALPWYVLAAAKQEPFYTSAEKTDQRLHEGEQALDKALALAPQSPAIQALAARYAQSRGDWVGAEQKLKAQEASSNSWESQYELGRFLLAAGKVREGIPYLQRASQMEPLATSITVMLQSAYEQNRNFDRVYAIADKEKDDTSIGALQGTALVSAMSQHDEALMDRLGLLLVNYDPVGSSVNKPMLAIRHDKPAALAKLYALKQALPNASQVEHLALSVWAVYLGDKVLAKTEMLNYLKVVSSPVSLWRPIWSEARHSEEFKQALKEKGLVDYLRATGWNDFCHPLPNTENDFECN
jgi:TolB-like protein